jgi:hypothetical protein
MLLKLMDITGRKLQRMSQLTHQLQILAGRSKQNGDSSLRSISYKKDSPKDSSNGHSRMRTEPEISKRQEIQEEFLTSSTRVTKKQRPDRNYPTVSIENTTE